MHIRFTKAYGKWIPGQTPDLLRQKALELITRGVAVPFDGKNTEAAQDAERARDTKEANQQPIVVLVEYSNSKTAPEQGGKQQDT